MQKKFLAIIFLVLAFAVPFQKLIQAADFGYSWFATYDSGSDDSLMGKSVVIDGDNSTIATGTFSADMDFDPSGSTAMLTTTSSAGYVTKLTGDGQFEWAKNIGENIFPQFIGLDSNNNIIISGTGFGVVDFDPGPGVHNETIDGPFLLKLNNDGEFVWVNVDFAEIGFIDFATAAVAPDGSIYQAVNFNDFNTGLYSVYVRHISDTGDTDNQFRIVPSNGFSQVQSYGLTVDSTNQPIILTSISGNVDFDPGAGTTILNGNSNVAVAKYTTGGNLAWAKAYGNTIDVTYSDTINSIRNNVNNDIFFAAHFSSASDIDPGPGTVTITPVNGNSFVVSKLDASGNYLDHVTTNSDGFSYLGILPKINGGMYLWGTVSATSGTIDLNPGVGTDQYSATNIGKFFLSDFDANFDYINSSTLTGSGSVALGASSIGMSSNEELITASGNFEGTIDFDGAGPASAVSSNGFYDSYLVAFDTESVGPTPTPTPSPTPTPTSTPTPTPTPTSQPSATPVPSSQPSSSTRKHTSTAKAPVCSDSTPIGTPDLFQINRTGTQAKLFFTPVNDNTQHYHVVFGLAEGQEQFGLLSAQVTQETNNGAQSITINDLDARADYWFKVSPVNGCAVGTWSNWMRAGRTTRTSIFYRYVPNSIQTLIP